MLDVQKVADSVLGLVKTYVDRSADAIGSRIAALEAKTVRDGRDGLPGRDGKDGTAGLDGKPGRDGADGLGFDDMSVEADGERGIVLRFSRGDIVKEFPVSFAIPIYQGTYKAGEAYSKGDVVTWAGSMWVAKQDTSDKPEVSEAWRLSVKRGRDGSNGKDGARGEPGRPGERGRDLTQIGPDGRKW